MYRYQARSHLVLFIFLGFCLTACIEQAPPTKTNNTNQTSATRGTNTKNINLAPGDPGAKFDPGRMAGANLAYGGLVYDKWWRASFQNPLPTQPAADSIHPLYPSTLNPMVGPDTFRCKECHGWDYLGSEGVYGDAASTHYTGIKGITSVTPTYNYNSDIEIWTFLHDGDSPAGLIDHAFGDILSDDDIYNLTRFVLTVREELLVDNGPANFIDPDKTINGNTLNGANLFASNPVEGGAGCADFRCHGPNGDFIFLKAPIGKLAQDNPWEVLHKIRFGQPGSMMVGITALNNPNVGIIEAVDILSFTKNALGANQVRGGKLFDNWPVETGMPIVNTVNRLWDLAEPSLTGGTMPNGAEAWRCVVCHGFDYEGNIAFYYNNLVYLKQLKSWRLEYVYQQIRFGFPAFLPDGTVQIVHEFGSHMLDTDLWELASFAINGIRDTSRYLQPDLGTAVGDASRPANPANGLAIYDGSSGATHKGNAFDCAGCHDPVNGTVPGVDIATITWSTPWQAFHRIRFGIPRTPDAPVDVLTMPGLLEVMGPDGINTLGTHDAVDVQRYLQESLLLP